MTITTSSNLRSIPKNTVLIIGNFDGVHLGHQSLINQALDISKSINNGHANITLMTFSPHPRQFFAPEAPPFQITSQNTKTTLLEKYGVKHIHIIKFDHPLSQMSYSDFIQDVLTPAQPNCVLIGENFFFGSGKKGTAQILKDMSVDLPFDVYISDIKRDKSLKRYSSTQIREFIKSGDIENANKVLGWTWEIEGTVIEGDKRGREFGFPTANMRFNNYIQPAFGVYAVRTRLKDDTDGTWLNSVANIGIRPMYQLDIPLIETYIFDFDKDIYGQSISIQPIKKIRDEMVYTTERKLINQIKQDCINARIMLESIQ